MTPSHENYSPNYIKLSLQNHLLTFFFFFPFYVTKKDP